MHFVIRCLLATLMLLVLVNKEPVHEEQWRGGQECSHEIADPVAESVQRAVFDGERCAVERTEHGLENA
jgi:hypothetical protein